MQRKKESLNISFPIDTLKIAELDERSSAQVMAFRDFARPLIDEIRKGDQSKAKIANYYLANYAEYTEGTIDTLQPLIESLNISKSYLCKLQQTKKFIDQETNQRLKSFMEQHPPTVQYLLTKLDPITLGSTALLERAVTFRQAQCLVKGEAISARKKTAGLPKSQSPSKEELRNLKLARLVNSKDYTYIQEPKDAEVYKTGRRKNLMNAFRQMLQDLIDKKYRNTAYDEALTAIQKAIEEVLAKEVYVHTIPDISSDPRNSGYDFF